MTSIQLGEQLLLPPLKPLVRDQEGHKPVGKLPIPASELEQNRSASLEDAAPSYRSKLVEPSPPVRTLKIEADGDGWKGNIKPKIRLMGRWLERGGFTPGNRVQVTCIALGVIELRFRDMSIETGATPPPSHHPLLR